MFQKFNEKLKKKTTISKSRLLGNYILLTEFSFFVGIVITIFSLGFGLPVSYFDMIDNIVDRAGYNMVAYSNLDDEVALNISDFCEPFDPNTQVECVISQIEPFYNYTNFDHSLLTPTEYKEKGGVCRDMVVLYKTIFTNLGWQTQYIFPYERHVFILISKTFDDSTIYCTIDGVTKKCVFQ